ncbi:MAG TPA: hypothetical protein VNK43_07855 [Gemmatimonadales bacterium]|nr:hypothetical protein [Gemmatimonadales bacterium]
MRCRSSSALALSLALGAAPAAGQTVREAGLALLATAADPAFAGGGLYGAIRTGERARLALTGVLGAERGILAGRGELTGQFLLDPSDRGGIGVYGGGGVAYLAGESGRGYLVLLVGLEASPGGRSGWAVEAGIGGGARIAAGWRWRWGGAP